MKFETVISVRHRALEAHGLTLTNYDLESRVHDEFCANL
jgi:hypothetical protein